MPAKYSEISRRLAALGIEIKTKKRGKGSHRLLYTSDGRLVMTFAHSKSGQDLDNSVVKTIARKVAKVLGDEFDEDAFVAEMTGRPQKAKVEGVSAE